MQMLNSKIQINFNLQDILSQTLTIIFKSEISKKKFFLIISLLKIFVSVCDKMS